MIVSVARFGIQQVDRAETDAALCPDAVGECPN